jgi:DNA-binding transcriptional LysR family regulator
MTDDMDGMAMFAAVAEARSFRGAGERLGVTASAVSQALRRLEERLGTTLVQRSTRSVRLTETGERLYATVGPALADLRGAVAAIGEMGSEPRGMLRLHVSTGADTVLGGPLLAGFLAEHPHVDLGVAVSDAPLDIVAGGYDAGIQLGEVIDRDMIAVPVSGDLRLVVVGAASYLARRGTPRHPRDLADHECINWHPTPDAPPYRWEFTEAGRDFSVAVRTRVLTTEPALLVRLARAGAGLTMLYEAQARDEVARGDLVPVLEEFSSPFPGYYLYYPQRRHASPALRAFVEHLRRARRPSRSKVGEREGTAPDDSRGTGTVKRR